MVMFGGSGWSGANTRGGVRSMQVEWNGVFGRMELKEIEDGGM
jgi:hypothetical protein